MGYRHSAIWLMNSDWWTLCKQITVFLTTLHVTLISIFECVEETFHVCLLVLPAACKIQVHQWKWLWRNASPRSMDTIVVVWEKTELRKTQQPKRLDRSSEALDEDILTWAINKWYRALWRWSAKVSLPGIFAYSSRSDTVVVTVKHNHPLYLISWIIEDAFHSSSSSPPPHQLHLKHAYCNIPIYTPPCLWVHREGATATKYVHVSLLWGSGVNLDVYDFDPSFTGLPGDWLTMRLELGSPWWRVPPHVTQSTHVWISNRTTCTSPCSSGDRSCLDLLVVALVGLPDECLKSANYAKGVGSVNKSLWKLKMMTSVQI